METNYSGGLMLFSSVLYGFCSGSMNFINKFLLTSWSFNQPSFMLLSQLPILVLSLRILKALGKVKLVKYDWKIAKSCALISFLYSANSVIALMALSGMNVPMYTALRRCIPLASMLLGYLMFTKRPTFEIIASTIVITIGAIVAAAGDVNFDFQSYAMGIFSAVLMSLHLLLLQKSSTEKQMSSIDLLYVNSINCMPIIALLCLGTFPDLLQYPHLYDFRFLLSFFTVVLAGCLLNYSMFLCTTVNSALTTSCVGVLKSGITTLIGIYAIGGIIPTPSFLIGQSINFTGGLMYAYAKYQQAKKKPFYVSGEENNKIVGHNKV